MGHLINPIQFRLGTSLVYNKNWPALNKDQYMLCYNIQKDFTDYFRTIFLLRKKLFLKRKNRKRKIFTSSRTPRLIFSSCNVNFFGFNLQRVLVDVSLFDMRFEAKWDSLFSRKYFENFLFQFSQVFRTSIIVSQPDFFINIEKALLKKFFIILNKQYHFVNGTLISQTTKWVKAYLAKIYQKFFSFFNDTAYLVNKRRTLRKAKRYIKKRNKDQHVYIYGTYKQLQRRRFVRSWRKLFLLLHPIASRYYLKIFNNKKRIFKIKKTLLKRNKYLFNFADLFDLYLKLLTHKFARKVRRKDLNHFFELIEWSKTTDYLNSIRYNIKYGLNRIQLAKNTFSLIPLEDKIRLYKAQSHYYLKYIILQTRDLTLDRYKRLPPVIDLYKDLFKKFDSFRPNVAKIIQHTDQYNFFNLTKNSNELVKFKSLVKILLYYIETYNICLNSVFKLCMPLSSSNIGFIVPLNNTQLWYTDLLKNLVLEVTKYDKYPTIVTPQVLQQLQFYKHIVKFKKIKRTVDHENFANNKSDNKKPAGKKGNKSVNNKSAENKTAGNKSASTKTVEKGANDKDNQSKKTVNRAKPADKRKLNEKEKPKPKKLIRITYQIKKHPKSKFYPIQVTSSLLRKNLLRNWIIKDGNRWLETLLIKIFDSINKSKIAQRKFLTHFLSKTHYTQQIPIKKRRKKLIKNKKKSYIVWKLKIIGKKLNTNKVLNPVLTKLLSPFTHQNNDLIWNLSRSKVKNSVVNNNKFETFIEMEHSPLSHSLEREKTIRGSVVPISKFFNRYHQKKKKQIPNEPEVEVKVKDAEIKAAIELKTEAELKVEAELKAAAELKAEEDQEETFNLPAFGVDTEYKHFEASKLLSNIDPALSEKRPGRDYYYKLDPFFQKYMKIQQIKSLQVNIKVDLGSKRMITAKFLSSWLKSLFKKGRKLTYVLRTLDRFIKPANNYINAVSVLFAGRFTRSAYTTYKFYRFGRLNSGEITKQMDYSNIAFSTKFGMCGIKVKLQYKVNVYAHRDLANYLKTSIWGSEAIPYKFDSKLHFPMVIRYGSKKILRKESKSIYKNNLSLYQFK